MSELEADLFLDCKYLLCPMPIMKIAQAIKQLEIGQTLLMETTDPGSRFDLPAWARRTGHELLAVQSDEQVNRFLVRRAR